MKTKAEAVGEIERLLNAIAEMDDGTDHERDYLVGASPQRLEAVIRELPTLAIHLLGGVGDGATNIVQLATRSGQLKGTVSKHVQRLVEAGLVERNPVDGNRKEIHLSLTGDGVLLDRAHRRMHDEKFDALRNFLLRYTGDELGTLAKVLGDLVESGPGVVGPLRGRGR